MMWIADLVNLRLDHSLLATWGRGSYVGSDWSAFEEEFETKVMRRTTGRPSKCLTTCASSIPLGLRERERERDSLGKRFALYSS